MIKRWSNVWIILTMLFATLTIFYRLEKLGFILTALFMALTIWSLLTQKDDNTTDLKIPEANLENNPTYNERLIDEFIQEYSLDLKYKFELKGITFTNAIELIKHDKIRVFEKLTLQAEPKNPYDKYAVAVYFGKEKIGYVEQDKSRGAKKIVEEGFTICYIHNIKKIYSEKSQRDIFFVDITLPYKMKS